MDRWVYGFMNTFSMKKKEALDHSVDDFATASRINAIEREEYERKSLRLGAKIKSHE